MSDNKNPAQIAAMHDLLEKLRGAINDGFYDKSHVAKVRLREDDPKDIETVEQWLELDGRTFDWSEPWLTIDSTKCQIPYI